MKKNGFLKGPPLLKKVLSFLVFSLCAVILTLGYFIFDRYWKNPEQIVPYPYEFETPAPAIKLDAPILMVGDEMGSYFAKFKTELAATISQNLDKPIGIQSLAKPGHGLHRTLHELRSLAQWPQILIYQGGSEEFSEEKFNPNEVSKIKSNFSLFKDDRLETAMILYPWLSRIVYEPIERTTLTEDPQLLKEVSESDYIKRLETVLLLFEEQLIELVNLSKDRNTLLILSTTPINLDIPPKKVCEFTSTIEIEKEIDSLEELLKANDPKTAYAHSSKLIQKSSGNAKLLFLHGQIAKRLGKINEAKTSLLEASAYDCNPWRSTEIFNSIIRKVARDHQVILFDFAKLIEDEWTANMTFFDETHPQNLYYERGMQQLGLVIKKILKL